MRRVFYFFVIITLTLVTSPAWAKRYIKDDDKSSSKSIKRQKGRAGIKSQDDWNWKNSSRSESIKEEVDRKRRISENEYQGRLQGREKRIKERKKIQEKRIKRRKNDRNRAVRGVASDSRFKDGETKWKGGGVKHTPEGPMKVEEDQSGEKEKRIRSLFIS